MQPENKVVALVARRINHKRKKRAQERFIYEHRSTKSRNQHSLLGVLVYLKRERERGLSKKNST